MKASYVATALCAATLFVTGVRAEEPAGAIPAATPPAATTAPAAPAVKPHATDAEIIARYDTNKDGKLDEDERAAVQMNTLDKKVAEKNEMRERAVTRLKAFDTDGDGKLSEAERTAMEKERREKAEKNPRAMKRIDTNGDGKLSDAEWAAVKDKVKERIEERKEK